MFREGAWTSKYTFRNTRSNIKIRSVDIVSRVLAHLPNPASILFVVAVSTPIFLIIFFGTIV
jgi:hypothetical protein